MRGALAEIGAIGVDTNVDLHAALISDAEFIEGNVDIHYLERKLSKETQHD